MAGPWEKYGAPEPVTAEGPWSKYAGPSEPVVAPTPAASAPAPSAARMAGIASSALSPYATAAGVGAALGAPAGGIGAIPGAVAGVGALALSDLAALGYNVAAPLFGGRSIQMPSEAISSLYQRGGMGVEPVTPEEKLLSSGLRGAASALGGVGAARTVAQNAMSPAVQRGANWLAAGPGSQASAGAAAGLAPTALREYAGVEDPFILGGASLAAGIAGGKAGPAVGGSVARGVDAAQRLATGANVSRQAIAQQADELFNAARATGATYTSQSFDDFVRDAARAGAAIDPRATELAAPVRQVLDTIENFRGAPNSVQAVHDLRQNINAVLDAGVSPRAGNVIRDIRDRLDEYISTPANVQLAGGDPAAGQQLLQGISTYSRSRRSEEILNIIDKASRNSSTPFASSVRAQFKQIANSPRRLNRFTPEERDNIRAIASGSSESQILKFVASLTPGATGVFNAVAPLAAGGLTYAGTQNPVAAAAAGLGMYGAGRGAQMLQNAMAQRAANQLAGGIRRGDVVAPTFTPASAIAGRVAPQVLMNAQSPYGELDLNAMAR